MNWNSLYVVLALLLNTGIAAYSVSRNKRYANAYRWRKKIEPVHLDLIDWAYRVRADAAKRGQLHKLPPLPKSVQEEWPEEEIEDDLDTLKRAGRHGST